MAKAMTSQWRSRILIEVSQRPLSPSQFVRAIGGELTAVSRCFRQLAEWDYVEMIDQRRGGRRRGGTEHVYRGIRRAAIDTPDWAMLPLFLREEFSGSVIGALWNRVTAAFKGRTFDQDPERHVSWRASNLDLETWREVNTTLDKTLFWLLAAEERAAERLAKSGEEGIPVTTAMLSFRMPREESSAPPRLTDRDDQRE